MIASLRDTAVSYAIVKRWAAHFKMGKESLVDDNRYVPLITATSEENIAHVYRVLMDDRRLTVNQIADTVGISHERVETILHSELEMSKVYAKWMLRLLSKSWLFLK